MARYGETSVAIDIWFLDSDCSNHITSEKSLFHELDETHRLTVKFGDDKPIQVEGKGTVALETRGKSWRTSKTLELAYADLCGPMRTKSFSGGKYFLLFTDDYSRMSWLYFQQFKLKLLTTLKSLRLMLRSKVKHQ